MRLVADYYIEIQQKHGKKIAESFLSQMKKVDGMPGTLFAEYDEVILESLLSQAMRKIRIYDLGLRNN